MPKTVLIRDLDDEVYARLTRRAAEAGLSVEELLRDLATRLAARPDVADWLVQMERRSSRVDRSAIQADLDEARGPWPGR